MNLLPPAGLVAPDHCPRLRSDAPLRQIGNEAIAWGPDAAAPTYLDPVGALLGQVFDGEATNADLIDEIADALEIGTDLARNQLERVLLLMAEGGLLEVESGEAPLFNPRHAQLPQPDW